LWIKPNCPQRSSGGQNNPAMHIIKKKALQVLESAGIPYATDGVRSACSEVVGANPDFRTRFGSGGNQEITIKVPRSALSDDILKVIDTCE